MQYITPHPFCGHGVLPRIREIFSTKCSRRAIRENLDPRNISAIRYVPEHVTLRNVDKNMLRVSCQPIEFYFPHGLDGTRSTTKRLRSVDENVVPPRACRAGADTYEQSAQSTSVLYSNSTTASRSQRLGYKRAGPSGLAELEQLHVESNSECNRHVYLSSSSTLSNSH